MKKPNKLSTATVCSGLIVHNIPQVLESGEFPLSLALVGGIDLESNISVCPTQRVRMNIVMVRRPVIGAYSRSRQSQDVEEVP